MSASAATVAPNPVPQGVAGAQAVRSAAPLQVEPATQAAQVVSVVADGVLVAPWPEGHEEYAVHEVLPVPAAYCPAVQDVQDVPPVDEVPAAQAVHVTALKVPLD